MPWLLHCLFISNCALSMSFSCLWQCKAGSGQHYVRARNMKHVQQLNGNKECRVRAEKEEFWTRGREMWERSVRGCRLSCSSRSSWLKVSAPSRSLCSHRLRPSVVDHLHNTHFQWVIAIHDWAHYLRHTITLAAGPLTSLNSADYVCYVAPTRN